MVRSALCSRMKFMIGGATGCDPHARHGRLPGALSARLTVAVDVFAAQGPQLVRIRSLAVGIHLDLQQPQPLSHRGALAAAHMTPGARVACTALTREVSFSFLLSFLWASILILAVGGSTVVVVVVCCSQACSGSRMALVQIDHRSKSWA